MKLEHPVGGVGPTMDTPESTAPQEGCAKSESGEEARDAQEDFLNVRFPGSRPQSAHSLSSGVTQESGDMPNHHSAPCSRSSTPLTTDSVPASAASVHSAEAVVRVNGAEKGKEKRHSTPNGGPRITCRAYVIVDGNTGNQIAGYREYERMPMASITKVMTALLVVQHLESKSDGMAAALATEVTISDRAARTNGTSAHLRGGDTLTVRELLHGLMLPSGNDAATALAEHFGTVLHLGYNDNSDNKENGSENRVKKYGSMGKMRRTADPLAQFVAVMNKKAASLGLRSTMFANPHGLNAPRHHSSCRDLAALSIHALQHSEIREVCATKEYNVTIGNVRDGTSRKVLWKNTNKLLGHSNLNIDGLKTGITPVAGACLSSTAFREDTKERLVIISLNSPSVEARTKDHILLYKFGWRLVDKAKAEAPGASTVRSRSSGRRGSANEVAFSNVLKAPPGRRQSLYSASPAESARAAVANPRPSSAGTTTRTGSGRDAFTKRWQHRRSQTSRPFTGARSTATMSLADNTAGDPPAVATTAGTGHQKQAGSVVYVPRINLQAVNTALNTGGATPAVEGARAAAQGRGLMPAPPSAPARENAGASSARVQAHRHTIGPDSSRRQGGEAAETHQDGPMLGAVLRNNIHLLNLNEQLSDNEMQNPSSSLNIPPLQPISMPQTARAALGSQKPQIIRGDEAEKHFRYLEAKYLLKVSETHSMGTMETSTQQTHDILQTGYNRYQKTPLHIASAATLHQQHGKPVPPGRLRHILDAPPT